MTVRRSHMTSLALLLVSAACTSPTEPTVSATVRVTADSIVATRSVEGPATRLYFRVPLTVQNHGPTLLRHIECATVLEVLVDSRWTQAWSPVCAAAGGITIPAGDVRNIEVLVSATVEGPGADEWSGRPNASYRMLVALYTAGVNGKIPQVASNAFAVLYAP